MQTVRLTSFSDYPNTELPPAVSKIPSMMSQKERSFLYGLAQREYKGTGVVLDAGVFCGASTVCFGTGVRDGKFVADAVSKWGKPVRTFEYGVVNPGMVRFFARHNMAAAYKVGDSFRALLEENIAPVSDLTKLTIGDICASGWSEEPIEIMFLDVIKSEEIQRHLLKTFYPSLFPGSILIQQDYFIDGLPFLKITQEALSPWFEYIGEVQSSAIFRVTGKIPHEELLVDPNDRLSTLEKVILLDQARDRSFDLDRKVLCELSKVQFLSAVDGEAAKRLLKYVVHRYPEQVGEKAFARTKMALRSASYYVKAAA